jgi:succinoglycan biosynthesis protein ExoL
MTRIAFFGHDAADAAVRRRVQGFRDDGLDVIGFTMHRRNDYSVDWDNVDLGRTFDAAYAQRVASIFRGATRAAAQRDKLASTDVIYARNLDMLATALLARRKAKLRTPVIYESLDVHRLLTRKDPIGFAFRRLEGALLKHTRRLVVSSPGFLANHFEKHHRGKHTATIIENRLAAGADYGPRPPIAAPASGALRVGWIGVLRCKRSLGLLIDAARQLGPAISIHIHGIPALTEIPDFHARIKDVPNIHFHDRYRSPEDLAAIYAGLDVVWAGDFMEACYNSVWLLPNRLYEGGYYGVPPIAPAGTQTAAWAESRGIGFTLPEDLATTLPNLFAELATDKAPIVERRARLLALPASNFVAKRGELARLIADTLGETHTRPIEDRSRHAAE